MKVWIYGGFMLCCLLWSPVIAEEKASKGINLAREVAIEEIKTLDSLPGVKASFCVKSTPEHIWSVLTNYNNFPKMYKGLRKISVRMSSDAGAEVEYSYSINFLGIFNKELNYVLHDQYSASHRRIVWKLVSGDLERIEGSWEIVDTKKDGTYLLEYRAYIKPPWYVPEYLVRSKVPNEVREMANTIRTCVERNELENHAGLSTTRY